MHRIRLFLLPSLLLGSAGCSPTGPDGPPDRRDALFPDCVGPATALDPALAATLPTPDENSFNMNVRWAALAARVPGGFAGVHMDNGMPVLRLVDVSQAPEAKAALAGIFDERFDIADADVRAARWDYRQLMDWWYFLYLRKGIMPGASGYMGVDVLQNRVQYGVEDARQRDRILRELSALDLPCGLVHIDVGGVIRDG